MNTKRFLLATLVVVITFIGYSLQHQPSLTHAQPDLSNVEFPSGNITLAGRVDLPVGDGPFPGVVMVHGSGRVPRTHSGFIASQLVNAGYAVLRYDKRGVGESEGFYSDVNPSNSEGVLHTLAQDALAGVAFLRSLGVVIDDQVGLFGNSQAGWIIPQSAAQNEAIAFSVILVGPAVSVGEEIFYSNLTGGNPNTLTDERLDEISERLANFRGRPGFHPRESIETMNGPAIWILGRRDASIPTRETVAILEDIKTSLDKDITIHVFLTGTHGLTDVNTGQILPFMNVALNWLNDIINAQ